MQIMSNTGKQDVSIKEVKKWTGEYFAPNILQALPIGVVVFNKELKILSANSSADKLISIRADADITLAIGTNKKIWGDWHKTLTEVVETGKTFRFDHVEYHLVHKPSLLQITCVPLTDDLNGVIQGGFLLLEDITEKANAQKQMATTERFAAMGKLASKVAHELNNPIDGIMRYINLAKRTIGEAGLPKPVEYLEHASDGLKRMVQIITELLEFSRSRYSALEDMSIDKIIDDAVKFIEPTAKAMGIEIERQYQSPLPKIKGGNLFQVFCNLLKNAVEAMPDGGRVIISCNISEDNVAVIKFRDTGQGFDPANSEEIFEPFFTTKTGKGTGLGLAICRDIIEKYGGKITAQNAPDGGSVFTVHLPLSEN
jgi:signal transduction histidine kinase